MLTVALVTSIDESLAEELAALQEFLLKGKHGRPLSADLFRGCVDTGFLVGARVDDELAGMCYLFIHQTLSRRVMFFEELVVNPKFRGLGVADRIDEFLIALARERNCDCIEGIMPVGNEPVKKVHTRNGFSIREQLPFRLILHHF